MSGESTSSTLGQLINTEWISDVMQDYLRDRIQAASFCATYDLRGKHSAKVAVPRFVSDFLTTDGTVSDNGAKVDAELDATEGTDLTNIALDSTDVTLTANEYGLLRTITDTVLEDNVQGAAFIGEVIRDASYGLAAALDYDVLALFASFTNSVTDTGVNITVAQLSEAITTCRRSGATAPGGLVCILDDQQMQDLDTAIMALGSSSAGYDMMSAQFANLQPAQNGAGMGTDGYFMTFRGVPCYFNGLCQTANTAADVVGGVFVRGDVDSNRASATLGLALAREFRVETQRDASLRATEVVSTMRAGAGILLNKTGCKIVTDF